MFLNVRKREEFYQGKMKNIFKPESIEETGDPVIEFAKACHKNSGLPLVSIANQDQGSSKFHNLVQIDCSLPVGVAASLKGIVRNVDVPLKQIYFYNNNLSGEELTSILLCPREDQFKQVRSIIYGKNELTSGAYECLKTKYLSKRPPNALHELKLVDVNYDESDLIPSHCKEYIGYIIDTVYDNEYVWLNIPQKRITKLKHDITRTLKKGITTARNLARITGQCISMSKAILPGKLLLRNLYRLL